MSGIEFLYAAMFILGFAGSALLVWWNRRRAHRRDRLEEVFVGDVAVPAEPSGGRLGKSSRVTPTELPAVEPEAARGEPPIAQLLFATGTGAGDRECPACARRFSDSTVLCPFDSMPLKPVEARQQRTARPAITGARRPTCSGCGRRYESAAKYCYHDGGSLSAATPDEVPIVRICRSCGFETLDPSAGCDCSTPDVLVVDPARSGVTMPTIPLMRCRSCDTVSSGDVTHCPHDGELLYPIMNVSMNALPPTGIGPRRKICEKCGRKFSSAARYCAYDGSSLKHLN